MVLFLRRDCYLRERSAIATHQGPRAHEIKSSGEHARKAQRSKRAARNLRGLSSVSAGRAGERARRQRGATFMLSQLILPAIRATFASVLAEIGRNVHSIIGRREGTRRLMMTCTLHGGSRVHEVGVGVLRF